MGAFLSCVKNLPLKKNLKSSFLLRFPPSQSFAISVRIFSNRHRQLGESIVETERKNMNSQNLKFEIGFWHPFGPHAGETAEKIIKRKKEEIEKNHGWTLWSFQHRRTLELWFKEIKEIDSNNILVFCSEGKGTSNTKSLPKDCTHYLPIGETEWRKIPEEISVPHPMREGMKKGSAFIVKNIIFPFDFGYEIRSVEWLKKDGVWQSTEKLPPRGEFLIKPGNGSLMRGCRAILELDYPYLAEVEYRLPTERP